MAEHVLIIRLTPGEPVHGLWCERCLLPSRFEVPIYRLTESGVGLAMTARGCTEHGLDRTCR